MTSRIGGFSGKTHKQIGKGVYNGSTGQIVVIIDQDMVSKELVCVVDGTIEAAFAGGSAPKINPHGVLHGLIGEMSVSRRGTDRLKSYRGTRQLTYTLERQFGQKDPTIYKVNSANLSGDYLQGLPTLGATTQKTAIRESFVIPFENKLSGLWEPTLFSTENLQTAKLVINLNAAPAMQDPEDATAVTSWGANLEFRVYASCSDAKLGDPKVGNADWNQTFEELSFSGQQVNSRKFITPQGMLQGILITGLYGGEKPFDMEHMKNTSIEMRYLGVIIAEGPLCDYLEIDCSKTMLSARKKGSAYLSLLHNSDFFSGLYIADGKNLELVITTDAGLSYSSPVRLVFEYDQIIFRPTEMPKVA